jgi:hypothetical protein
MVDDDLYGHMQEIQCFPVLMEKIKVCEAPELPELLLCRQQHELCVQCLAAHVGRTQSSK